MNIQNLINSGANVAVTISLLDLREWALELMNESKQEKEEDVSDNYLSVGEVIDKLRVNASTLWRWDKSGYLKKLKVGGKVRYRESDVIKLMEG
ncbi:helix-turn-helix domain-containing protein [Bacteroides sp. AN502]|nr:helix-turn-helix domain-containing protein [Caecibacteroides pullorum]MDC6279182.1 helix-turn-helix domain-containing protein [Caecibacteroides pullorum]